MEIAGTRERWVDNAKAFAIILVVIGHVISQYGDNPLNIVYYYIYCFHMEMFFILSGMSYRFSKQRRSGNSEFMYTIRHCFDLGWMFVIWNLLGYPQTINRFLNTVTRWGGGSVNGFIVN